MTDPRLDFLDRLEAATRERMRRVDGVAGRVGAIRGRATSPDGLVTTTVAPSGALVDLVLADDATDLDATELAGLVMATVRTATEQATGLLQDAVQGLDEPLEVAAGGRPGSSDPAPGPRGTADRFDAAVARAERVADEVEAKVRRATSE